MIKFIPFQLVDRDKPIYINPDFVTYVREASAGTCYIGINGENYYHIKKSAKDAAEVLEKAYINIAVKDGNTE